MSQRCLPFQSEIYVRIADLTFLNCLDLLMRKLRMRNPQMSDQGASDLGLTDLMVSLQEEEPREV